MRYSSKSKDLVVRERPQMYSHLVKPEDSQLEQFLAGCLAGVLSKYARDANNRQNQEERRHGKGRGKQLQIRGSRRARAAVVSAGDDDDD